MTLTIDILEQQAKANNFEYKRGATNLSDDTIEIQEDLGIFHTFYLSVTRVSSRVVYEGRHNVMTGKTINTFHKEYRIKSLLNLY